MSDATDKKETYQQSFQKLEQIATRLANSQEVDIDELVPMVDEATRAYQNCKSRIEAVEAALSKRLETTEGNAE